MFLIPKKEITIAEFMQQYNVEFFDHVWFMCIERKTLTYTFTDTVDPNSLTKAWWNDYIIEEIYFNTDENNLELTGYAK